MNRVQLGTTTTTQIICSEIDAILQFIFRCVRSIKNRCAIATNIQHGLEIFLNVHNHIRAKLLRQLYVGSGTGNLQLDATRGLVPHVYQYVVFDGVHHNFRSFRVEEPIVPRITYPVEHVRWIDRQLTSALLSVHLGDVCYVAELSQIASYHERPVCSPLGSIEIES